MTDARLATARAAFDAWNGHDADAFVAAFHPDCEVHAAIALGAAPYHGHEGVRRWIRDVTEGFGEFVVTWDELRPVDDTRVLALGRVDIEGVSSGIAMSRAIGYLATFEGDLIKRVQTFTSRAEAEAAAAA